MAALALGATTPPTPPAPACPARRARLGPVGRLVSLALAAACLAVLLVAVRLSPAPAGHGTHTALGLPACSWVAIANIPCPTCGMTTAFAHAVRAQPAAAFRAQPAGAILALMTPVVFWGALTAAITGARLHVLAARLASPRAVWVLAGLWAASWLYKIATWHA